MSALGICAGVHPFHYLTTGAVAAATFCWLDNFGGDDTERKALLAQVGLDETDLAWAQRFGQAGRLMICQTLLPSEASFGFGN